jgi:hypothetical protein
MNLTMSRKQGITIAIIYALTVAAILFILSTSYPAHGQSLSGTGTISVEVLADGTPVQGVNVTFTQRGQFLKTIYTNGSGIAGFPYLAGQASYLEYQIQNFRIGSTNYQAANSTYAPTGDPEFYNATLITGQQASYRFYAYFHGTPDFAADLGPVLINLLFIVPVAIVGAFLGVRWVRHHRGGYKIGRRVK